MEFDPNEFTTQPPVDQYKDYAKKKAQEIGIPEGLFLGYFDHESGWNPTAKNPNSSATGLGQQLKNNPWIKGDRTDPYASIDGIATEMQEKYNKSGSWETAVKNTGEGTNSYLDKVLHAAKTMYGYVTPSNAEAAEFDPKQYTIKVPKKFDPKEFSTEPPTSVEQTTEAPTTDPWLGVVRKRLQEGAKPAQELQHNIIDTQDNTSKQETLNIADAIAGSAMDATGSTLPAIAELAKIIDLPFTPLHFLKEKAQEGLAKVGGPFAPTQVPLVSGEAAAGIENNPMVEQNLAKLLPELVEFAALGPYTKLLGLPIRATSKILELQKARKGFGVLEELPEAAPFDFMEQPITSRMSTYTPKPEILPEVSPGDEYLANLLQRGSLEESINQSQKTIDSFKQDFPTTLQTGIQKPGELLQVQFPTESKLTPTPLKQMLRGSAAENQRIINKAPTWWSREQKRFIPGLLGAGAIGATVSTMLGPNEAEAGVTGPIADALSALAKMGAKEGPELIGAVAGAAVEHGVDVASLMAKYRQMAATGELAGLSMEQTGKVAEAAALSGVSKIPVPPNTPTIPVPPITEPPKSVAEFAQSFAKTPKPTRRQFEIPDKLDVPKIDPVAPKPVSDMSRLDFERSPNIVSANYLGRENNLVGDFAQSTINFQNTMPLVTRVFNNLERKYGLTNDIHASEKEMIEKMGPVFEAWSDVTKPIAEIEANLKTEQEFLKHYGVGTQAHTDSVAKIADLQKQYDTLQQTTKNALEELYISRDSVYKELAEKYTNVRVKAAAEGKDWAISLLKPEEVELVNQTRKYLDLTKVRMQAIGMKTLADNKAYVPYIFQTGQYGKLEGNFVDKLWYSKRHSPDPIWLDFVSRSPNSGDWFPLWSQSMSAYIPTVERRLAFNPTLAKWTPAINSWRASNEYPNAAKWATDFLNRNLNTESTNALMKGLDTFTNLEYLHYLSGSVSTAFLHLFKLLQTPIWHGFIPTIKGVGDMIKAINPESAERALYNNYVQARLITKAVAQAPGMGEFLESGWWKGILQKGLNNSIVNPTRLIESWDNGVNMFAALHSGLTKGAEAGTINRAILETQMLLNFRGFATPRIFTASGMRMLTQFQATPFKLMENKIDLIKKGLTGETDIYGRSDFNKLVRLVTLLGLGFGTSEMFGVDLNKHLGFHIPFTSETPKGDLTLAASPIIKNMATTANEGFSAGLKQQFSYWGPVQKVAEEYIPEKYGGSKLQQILGIPNKGWEEKGKHREIDTERNKVAKKLLKGRMLSPYEYLQNLRGKYE